MNNMNELTRRANLCEVDINHITNQIRESRQTERRRERLERDVSFLRGKIEAYREAVAILKQGETHD